MNSQIWPSIWGRSWGVCECRNSLRPQSQWRQCCTPIQGPSAEQVVVCIEEASTA